MTTDLELLRRYAQEGSEEAFAALVKRHLDLVYSAALRQVRSPQLAEEVAQSVFADLSRNACKLGPDTILPAWLYQVTRRAAIDVVRRESRRQCRERIAQEISDMNSTSSDWTLVEPLLEEAMEALDETDRGAILLRYFENKSLREVGQVLKTSEDAAQKRVSRAVERLREFFSKRGVTVGASSLVAVVCANAVQSAPAGLAVTISSAAAIALQTSGAIAATNALAMTTLQKTFIGAALALAVGTGIYQARQASTKGRQVRTLQEQRAPLIEQNQQLRRQRNETTIKLATLQQENEQLRRDTAELGKLRGEVARLRADAHVLAQLKEAGVQKGIDPTELALISWLDRAKQIKRLPEKMPDKMIPELRLLSEDDWLQMCKDPLRHLGKEVNLDDDSTARLVFSHVRMKAKEKFGDLLSKALHGYTDANSGQLPADMLQLKPYFESVVEETTLRRYEILQSGKMEDVPNADVIILAEKTPVDNQYDTRLVLGKNWRRIDNNVEAYFRENPSPGESQPLEK